MALKWPNHDHTKTWPGWAGHTPDRIATAIARLPSLAELAIDCPHYDELIVRLLVLAENGGLSDLEVLGFCSTTLGSTVTAAAVILLLMWVKSEATKVLRGQEPGAL